MAIERHIKKIDNGPYHPWWAIAIDVSEDDNPCILIRDEVGTQCRYKIGSKIDSKLIDALHKFRIKRYSR